MFIVFLEYSLLYMLSYWAVFVLFTEFFGSLKWPSLEAAARTIGAVVLVLAMGFILVRLIPDEWWGNRVQHALCGGVTAFYMCYRIIRDAALRLTRFQTVIICCFTVTALGVANELANLLNKLFLTLSFPRRPSTPGLICGAIRPGLVHRFSFSWPLIKSRETG